MTRSVVRGKALVEGAFTETFLVCRDGKFEYVGPTWDETPDVVVETGCIVPGYVDVHVHGLHGHDVMDGTKTALKGMSEALAGYGVTGFLATTLTGEIAHLERVLTACKTFAEQDAGEGAELLGVHLEGPWINVRYKGAQNAEHVAAPAMEDVRRLWEAAGGLLRIVTLAPELERVQEAIAWLTAKGVKASVGHSDAAYEHVRGAMEHGLCHVTHCFNAMRGLHHREPGVVGAALYHDELTCELIADGVHVHPVVMSILCRVKQAERLVLVSDAMRATGLSDGRYELGGLDVWVEGGEARLADGTLAGSTLTLDQAVRNLVRVCGVPLEEAVRMASETPARVIGCGERKGRLQQGYDADFLILDEDLQVVMTYRGGRCVYRREDR
jgi:N-acetylglucosamine-6-phosphate deacetylase